MKQFKKADAWISVILILGSIVVSSIVQGYSFIGCYIIVGAWQVISMLVHFCKRWFTEKSGIRTVYHIITLLALVSFPLSMYVLLFIAPFMALFYTILCFDEVYHKMRRPMSQLR